MALKIEFFFDQGEQGWSEQWYAPSSFVGGPLAYFGITLEVAKLRQRMLAANCYLRVIRISDPESPRTSQHTYALANTINTLAGRLTRDVAGTGVRFDCYSAGRLYRRSAWLRGLPDDWVEFTAGLPSYRRDFLDSSKAYFDRIIAEGWSIQAVNKEEPPNGPATRRIEDMTRNGATGRVQVKVTGHGYTQGQLVRIRGAQFVGSILQVNRRWPVDLDPALANPVNNFLIDEQISDLNFGTYNGHGTVRLQVLTYAPIRFIDRVEPSAHDVGRVSYTRRGRARRRGPSRDQRVSDRMGAPPQLFIGPLIP